MNIYRKCIELLESGMNVVQITVVKSSRGTPGKPGFKLLLTDNNETYGTVGGGALEHRAIEEAGKVLKSGENQIFEYNLKELGMKCGGRTTLVLEYLKGVKSFMLFGGGHIGQALTPILVSLGFHVTVFDSRKEVREKIVEGPQKSVVIGDYNDLSPVKERIKASEFAFIATHGHEHDYTVLKQILEIPGDFRYIGLIGSRKKVKTTLERLEKDSLAVPEYLFAPVGINIGGDTAAEIVVSIAAEVVACIHDVPANHLRDRVDSVINNPSTITP